MRGDSCVLGFEPARLLLHLQASQHIKHISEAVGSQRHNRAHSGAGPSPAGSLSTSEDDCRSCSSQMTDRSRPALSACNRKALSLFFHLLSSDKSQRPPPGQTDHDEDDQNHRLRIWPEGLREPNHKNTSMTLAAEENITKLLKTSFPVSQWQNADVCIATTNPYGARDPNKTKTQPLLTVSYDKMSVFYLFQFRSGTFSQDKMQT